MNDELDEYFIQIANRVCADLEELWSEKKWKGSPPIVTVGVVELVWKRIQESPRPILSTRINQGEE